MARKSSKSTVDNKLDDQELNQLRAEVVTLRAELDKYKKQQTQPKRARKSHARWQSFFAGMFAFLAIVSFTLFNLSYWTQQTIVDNQQFVKTMSPIIQNSDVQKTLQTEISKQIFSRINLESELNKVLPANLQFISAPLASQFESFTTDKIGETLQSQQVQQIWVNVLSTTHQKLIDYIQNPNNDGNITVDEVYKAVGDQLSQSQIGFLFGKNLPSSIGSITVKQVTWLPKARQALNTLDNITKELGIATVITIVLAFALSRSRAMMAVKLLFFGLLAMGLTLLGIKIIGMQVTSIVSIEQYAPAAKAVYGIITAPLIQQTQGFALLFIAAFGVILVVSPLDWMIWLRKKMRQGLDWLFGLFAKKMHAPQWLSWISDNRFVIGWTLLAVSFFAFALRLPPTVSGVVTGLAVSAIAVFILELIASFCRVANFQK